MTQMLRNSIAALFFVLITNIAIAQPSNNDCASAIQLTQLDGTCSGSATYNNINATASGQGPTGCFSNTNHDVWFSFVAQATDVTVTINGNNTSGGGSMVNPQVGLLTGSCGGTLTMFHCATDVGTNNNGVEMYGGALTIGQTYYIRVDAANMGTFEICVNNFFAPPTPESDCSDAVVLCDKAPFTVQSVSGAGNNTNEMSGSPCGLSETNSSWYTWTCDQSGTLEFTLTPTNAADDLDFIVYRLDNGSCNQRTVLRCMAAGDFQIPSPCMGATGLGNGATDITEQPGCGQGQDNWLLPLSMVSGERYALVVNNYTSSGNGFQISFGGSGTFVGPSADFVNNDADNTICVGDNIVFTDNSTFPNGSDGWAWNFGVDANPQVGGGPGPHTVSYSSPGVKSIALTVESALGCVVSTVQTIQVNACCETANPITASFTATDNTCNGDNAGALSVSGTTGYPPFTYQWNNGSVNGTSGSNLYSGTYSVTMTDEIGCDTILNIPISEPPAFNITPNIVRPTCNGGTDGSITLSTSGATPNYQYDWGNGPTNNNIRNGLSNGTYNVTVVDALGCDTVLSIPVFELTLELDTLADFVIEPTCFGFTDGSITITMANGQPAYQFDWGSGFQSSNSLFNLGNGTYTLSVIDVNNCQGGPFQILVEEPDELIVSTSVVDVTCFDGDDGEAVAIATGGNVGSYNFSWSNGSPDSINANLIAGNYLLTVTDVKGCTDTASAFVRQPMPIIITSIDVVDAFCYADSNGSVTPIVTGGTPPFEYSIDGINYQPSSTIGNLRAGHYTVYVRDAFGCEYTRNATVYQPLIFYVDAGDDQTIELGYEAEIEAFANTPPENVTYTWTPPLALSCTDCSDPVANPVSTTTYTVLATNERGCPATDSLTIFVEILRPFFVPNVFTPNYDGNNDNFYVYGGPAIRQVRTLRVFDRWGGHVFRADNIPANTPNLGWDGLYRGKRVKPDVFVFYIEIEFVDGHIEVVKGDVTVMR